MFLCLHGEMRQFDMRDIVYVEYCSRTSHVHTAAAQIDIPYMPLNHIYCLLGTDYLIQCHKSFLVNRMYIQKIDRTSNRIVLKNNLGEIPLGRRYKSEFLKKLHYI